MGYLVVYPGLDLLAVIVIDGIVNVYNWGNMGVLCFYRDGDYVYGLFVSKY